MNMKTLNETVLVNKLDEDFTVDWGVRAIKAPQVWSNTLGEGVKIATIDTGIDNTHPDLRHKIKGSFNFTERDLNTKDEYGHGSHVAGLLVGSKTGVAPMADLYVAKVLDSEGYGAIGDIMDGISFAIQCEVDVLCISLGTPTELPLILRQRIVQAYEKGITIVCAVGNNGDDKPLYPAIMDEVIGVGGLDENLDLTMFTNMGYDVLAPSVDILSTYKDNNYAKMTGTSMASPLVAGGIALLISYYRKQGKELSPREIKEMIQGKKFDLTELIG